MTLSKAFFALSIIGALTTSVPAWADIPPDDECFAAMLGKSCSNAMNDGESQPGVCKETMCTRATPDGSMTYTCYRCEPTEQGTGGQPNEAGAGGEARGGGSAGTAPTQPPGGSSAGGAASGSAGSGAADAKSGSSPVSDDPKRDSGDGGGCSVARVRGGAGALGLALAVLGFAVAGWRRRRSQPS